MEKIQILSSSLLQYFEKGIAYFSKFQTQALQLG